jgi:hypothetical protein
MIRSVLVNVLREMKVLARMLTEAARNLNPARKADHLLKKELVLRKERTFVKRGNILPKQEAVEKKRIGQPPAEVARDSSHALKTDLLMRKEAGLRKETTFLKLKTEMMKTGGHLLVKVVMVLNPAQKIDPLLRKKAVLRKKKVCGKEKNLLPKQENEKRTKVIGRIRADVRVITKIQ